MVHIQTIATIFLNPALTSEDPAVVELVEHVFADAVVPTYRRVPRGSKARAATMIVVLNLFRATRLAPDSPWCLYSRDRNFYSGSRIGYRRLVEAAIPALVDSGWINVDDTKREDWAETPDVELECSRMRPAQKLLDAFAQYRLSISMITELEPSDLVVCKAPARRHRTKQGNWRTSKKRIESPKRKGPLQQIRAATKLLQATNQLYSKSFIGYFESDQKIADTNLVRHSLRTVNPNTPYVDPFVQCLRRVFNNVSATDVELKYGGRFVGGWWQTIPSEDRNQKIWINDAFGIELDFSSMEPVIAYAQESIRFDFDIDPYALPDYPNDDAVRGVLKTILLVCLNIGDRGAVEAVRNALYEKFAREFRKRTDETAEIPKKEGLGDSELLWPGCPPLEEVVRAIFRKHSQVLPSSKLKGLHRMYVESLVAEQVIRQFIGDGEIVLPIHDSFVVHPSNVDKLGYAMMEALVDVANSNYAGVKLESGILERTLLPASSVWLGPSSGPENLQSSNRLYPWNVDEHRYGIFFERWRAIRPDYREIMSDLREKKRSQA